MENLHLLLFMHIRGFWISCYPSSNPHFVSIFNHIFMLLNCFSKRMKNIKKYDELNTNWRARWHLMLAERGIRYSWLPMVYIELWSDLYQRDWYQCLCWSILLISELPRIDDCYKGVDHSPNLINIWLRPPLFHCQHDRGNDCWSNRWSALKIHRKL